MASGSVTICLPLGISRARTKTDLELLEKAFGRFEFIDFNLGRVSERAFSLRIIRTRVPTAQGGVMTLDETVTGVADEDVLRLTYGERLRFEAFGDSKINVTITPSK